MTDLSPPASPLAAPFAPLTRGQQGRLLEIAREALFGHVRRGIRIAPTETDPRLKVRQGVFVTLLLGDHVRACMGVLDATLPLYEAVIDVIISTATDDPRESSLRGDEVSRVEIELSVIGPRAVCQPTDVVVGRHGLFVQRERSVGVLLPQVATQFRWDQRTFLAQACLRAGLPEDAWSDPATRLEAFTADVFAESRLRRSE
jgi:AmmeMemoRadiSam system protein A